MLPSIINNQGRMFGQNNKSMANIVPGLEDTATQTYTIAEYNKKGVSDSAKTLVEYSKKYI